MKSFKSWYAWMFDEIKQGDDLTPHFLKATIGALIIMFILIIIILAMAPPAKPVPNVCLNEVLNITEQLEAKVVGDCILEKTSYGWKCTDRDGKIFTVYSRRDRCAGDAPVAGR